MGEQRGIMLITMQGLMKAVGRNLMVRPVSVVDFDGDGQHNIWIIDMVGPSGSWSPIDMPIFPGYVLGHMMA